MKKIKASIKKIVGLKLSNPKHKYWVQLFTKDYSKSSSSIPPIYKDMINSFYYETVPTKSIFSHSNEIESNPDISIPKYLELDQKIKDSYFEFCERINIDGGQTKNEQKDQNLENLVPVPNYRQPNIPNFNKIMEIVVPHLIRFSIGFTYQFERNLPYLIDGNCPPDNSINFNQLNRYSAVHEMIIRCGIEEQISNYVNYVLSPLFEILNPILRRLFSTTNDTNSNTDEIRNFALGIAQPLIDIFIDMCVNNQNEDFWDPCFTYISLISTNALPFIESELRPLITGSLWIFSNLKNLLEDAKVASLAFSSQTLQYLAYSGTKNNNRNENIIDNYEIKVNITSEQANKILINAETIGILAIAAIENMSDLHSWNAHKNFTSINEKTIVSSLLDYFETVFFSIMVGNPPTIFYDDNCLVDLSKGIINDISFTYDPLIRMNKDQKEWKPTIIEKKKYEDFPPSLMHMKGGQSLRDIYMHLKIIAEKNEVLAVMLCEKIFDEFKERKKDLRTLFFTFLTCKFLPPSIVSSVIMKRNSWNFLLNDRVLLPLAKYNFDLADTAEEVSVLCFSSSSSSNNQYSIIEAVSSLLYTSSILRALNIVEQLIITSPQKFVSEIGKGSFIDIIFRIESSIRQTIVNYIPKGRTRAKTQAISKAIQKTNSLQLNKTNSANSFSFNDLLELRSRIISIIKQISLLNTSQLIYPTERCSHLLSLFFELPLQNAISEIIKEALFTAGQEKLVIGCIVDFVSATIQMVLDSDWRNMVLMIVNLILETAIKSEAVGNSLVETSIVSTLHKAVREITEKKGDSSMHEFCISILMFITSMCSCNKVFFKGLITHSAEWEFRTTWANFFHSKTIKTEELDLLWKLTFLGDETVIRNTEGLWLLASVMKPTNDFVNFVRKVTQMCKYSIFNRFQCSQADIILIVLDVYKGDNDERMNDFIDLIKIIGSSFFKPSELSEYFTKIQMKQSIKLIQIFTEIVQETCNNAVNGIRSFFHIGSLPYLTEGSKTTSKFTIGSTKIDFKPYIMFNLRFGKNSENGHFPFLTVNINNNGFVLTVDLYNLRPILKSDKLNINVNKQFESLRWMKFIIYIGKNEIIIYVDDKVFYHENSIKVPMMLSSLSFTIEGAECDIESVAVAKEKVQNDNNGLVALYSAHVLEGGVCLNIFHRDGYNFPSALFDGMSVPFTIHVINTISSCGGVRILLPLFEIMRRTSDLCLLRAVDSIVQNYESMFIDQFFFRALSGILPDKLTIDFFKLFTEMYRKVKTSELKTEMLNNIFCNWNLLQKADLQTHKTYLQIYLPIVLASCPELFSALFSVKSFFTQILLENECVWGMIDRFCIFQFTNDDFVSMLSAAVDNSVSSTFAMNALKTILIAIDKHDKVIDLLKDFDYFEPFFPVFQNYQNEDIWIVVFQIFSVIAERKPESMPSVRLLNCFSIINLDIITEKTLDLVIGIILANDRTSMIQYTKNAQFIPFLCFILHCFPEKKSRNIAKMIYESISVYDRSQTNLVKCTLWQFWLLYLSNFDKTIEEWISLIAKVPPETQESIEYYSDLEALFFIYSEIANKDFHMMMIQYLSVAMTKRPSVELAVESFKYIFFNPKPSPKKFEFPNELLRDLKQLSKYFNSVLIDWSPNFVLSIRFDTRMMKETNCQDSAVSAKWLDLDLAQKCINYLLSNKSAVSKNVQFFTTSMPLSYLLTFALHILSITNFKYACEILPKVLSVPAIRSSKPLLCFLLLDFNGRDHKSQTEIGHILCPTTILPSEKDTENGKIKPVQPPTNVEMVNLMDILSKEALKFQECFDTTREKNAVKLMATLEQTYNSDLLRKVILPKFDEILLENKESLARLSRRNHRIWTSIELELVKNGAIWSTVSSEGLHWKIAQVLDGVGRKNQMKVNRHFDNHIDASKERDNEKVNSNMKDNVQKTKVFERKFKLESIHDEEADENASGDGKVTHLKSAMYKFECTLITVNANYKGTLYFTRGMISFESYETTNEFGQKKESRPKFVDVRFDDALYIFKRRFLHQQIGAEVFTNKRRGFFFIFNSKALRKKFVSKMTLSGVKYVKKVDEFTNAWKTGRLTNYEYLFWINMLSGRSFNDIAQYPVFPWVLTDYSSPKIDLNDPSKYRDLSKTIGAMNKERLDDMLNKYNDLKNSQDTDFPVPISLFRLHYSTPGYVIYYLIRSEPFTSLHIELQGGKFDNSSRLFKSIEDSFKSVVSSTPDYRELIPEFFSTSEFLINSNHFDLGKGVDDVVLPKWATNASQFVAMNRIALESPCVSLSLHKWIDLIFGFKQQDVNSYNHFSPFSDPRYFDLSEKSKHEQIMMHAANFGVNPIRLFSHPHPRRTFIPMMPDFGEPQLMTFRVLARNMNARPILMWTRSNQMQLINEQVLEQVAPGSENSMQLSKSQINNALKSVQLPSCELFAVVENGSLVEATCAAAENSIDGSKGNKKNKESEVTFKTVSKFKIKFQTAQNCNLTFDFISHFTSLLNSHGLFAAVNTSSFFLSAPTSAPTTPSFSCDFSSKEMGSIVAAGGSNGIYGDAGLVVVSSPWSSAFDVIDTARGKIVFASQEDSMPASITALAADGCYVITGAQDASLCVWNVVKQRMTAQIHAHEHKVVCVAYNDVCDLIASVDTSGKFSFSSVRAATFTRSTILPELQNSSIKTDKETAAVAAVSLSVPMTTVQRASGRVLTKIEISSLGFVVLFSEERNMTDVTTVLESFDFSQRRIESCKIPGRVTSSCLCVFQDDSQFLLVAMSTHKVFLYNVMELTRRAAYGEVPCAVKCCTFSRERSELFLSLENNDLLSYRFV